MTPQRVRLLGTRLSTDGSIYWGMGSARPNDSSRFPAAHAGYQLLVALVQGIDLDVTVPAALEMVDRDPLGSVGQFPGDVLRALMEVPGDYWTRHRGQYDRYRDALRAGAAMRRTLPPDHRFDFWTPLGIPTGRD